MINLAAQRLAVSRGFSMARRIRESYTQEGGSGTTIAERQYVAVFAVISRVMSPSLTRF